MKHTKRIAALLLCAAMAFTPVLTPVYAVDTGEEPEIAEAKQEHVAIGITQKPDKLYYHIGEELDLTGGVASASGSDGMVKWDTFYQPLDSRYFHVNASEFDSTKPGTYTIYVSAKGESKTAVGVASFDVVVLPDGEEAPDDPSLREYQTLVFWIDKLPDKLTYKVGEKLDLTGAVGYASSVGEAGNATGKPLTDFRVNTSEFDSSEPGIYTIYVNCRQDGMSKSDGFTVTVEKPEETEETTEETSENPTEETFEKTTLPTKGKPSEQITFYITKLPEKLNYQIGEALDLTGGTAFAGGTYDDGSGNVMNWDAFEQPMTFYEVDASAFDNTKPGIYQIHLTCKGQLESKTVSFDVTVDGKPTETVPPTTLPPTTDPTGYPMNFCVHNPSKQFYKIGDELDLTGGYAWMQNGDTYEAVTSKTPLTDQQYTIDASKFDNSKSGSYPIRVTYGTYTHEFTVVVMNADGTPPEGIPVPTGTDNPYNTEDAQETTQALDRVGRHDINGDGVTDIMDIIILNKHLLGVSQMSGLERTFADSNMDGKIDADDSIALLKRVINRPVQNDPVEPTTVPKTAPTTEPETKPTEMPDPVEATELTTDGSSRFVPGKISDHFYGARIVRGNASDGMQSSIDVVTDANNSLIGLYDPEFYEKHNLIIIEKTESSGSYRLTVDDVKVDADGVYTVMVTRTMPEIATCDLARWYLYVATDKGVTDPSKVNVEFTENRIH